VRGLLDLAFEQELLDRSVVAIFLLREPPALSDPELTDLLLSERRTGEGGDSGRIGEIPPVRLIEALAGGSDGGGGVLSLAATGATASRSDVRSRKTRRAGIRRSSKGVWICIACLIAE